MNENILKIVKAFLNYSLEPIDYDYRNLTNNKKCLCNPEEFADLVKWLRENDEGA